MNEHSITTHSGKYFDLLSPEGFEFDINDIAWALSHLCRFTGHTNQFYSVAQHSYHVSVIVPEPIAMHALLHDAAEAFIGDVSSPLKALLPEYKEIEKRIETALFSFFGLSSEIPADVKKADLVMLATERKYLIGEQDTEWDAIKNITPIYQELPHMTSLAARKFFIDRFNKLI